MNERARRAAIAAFCAVHIAALTWWNLGVVTLDHDGTQQASLRSAAEAVDPARWVRGPLEAYVRATGLWQQWVLFAPDAPHRTGAFSLHAIERGPDGHLVVDPRPFLAADRERVFDRTRMIGQPPCGFQPGDAPTLQVLRGAYATWHAARFAELTGRPLAGVELRCTTRPLPAPGAGTESGPPEVTVLWAGPLSPAEGPP